MAIVAEDNFTRANQADWGTSTNGAGVTNFAWAGDMGVAGNTDITIAANVGDLFATPSSRYGQLDDGSTRQTGEIVVECNLSATNNTFGALACYHGTSGVGTDWYLARYDGAGHIALLSRKSNTNTTQATAAFTITTGHTYRIRFNITLNGSSQPVLEARIWDTSGGEPGTWNVTWTDTGTAVSAGHWGAYGFANAGQQCKYTFYSLDDLSGGIVSGSASLVANAVLAESSALVLAPATVAASAALAESAAIVTSTSDALVANAVLGESAQIVASGQTLQANATIGESAQVVAPATLQANAAMSAPASVVANAVALVANAALSAPATILATAALVANAVLSAVGSSTGPVQMAANAVLSVTGTVIAGGLVLAGNAAMSAAATLQAAANLAANAVLAATGGSLSPATPGQCAVSDAAVNTVSLSDASLGTVALADAALGGVTVSDAIGGQ